MKTSASFVLLVLCLAFSRPALSACDSVWASNQVKQLSCGEIRFKFNIEKGNGAVKFDWFIDNQYFMTKNDFIISFVGKRYIPFIVHISNDCSDFKVTDSIWFDYEPVDVMASYELQNCSEAKFHFISSNQNQLPKYYEWTGDDGLSVVNEWEPTHIYPGPGKYKYTLKYLAEGACDFSYYNGIVDVKNTAAAYAGDNQTICLYSGQQIMQGIPAGGIWSGNGIDGNIFDPEKAGIGTHQITYTIFDGVCQAKDNITIVIKDINPDFTADVLEGTAPLKVNFSGKVGTSQFVNWDFGDPSAVDNTSTLPYPSHTYDKPGVYNVTLNIEDQETGCSGERIYKKMIKVSDKAQHVIHIDRGVAVYPNPTRGSFKFVIEKPESVSFSMEVLDLSGQLVSNLGTNSQPTVEVNLANLASGIYMVKVNLEDGKTLTAKIIILN